MSSFERRHDGPPLDSTPSAAVGPRRRLDADSQSLMRGGGVLGLLALLLLAIPGTAPAQPPGKTPRIGVLVWWSAGTAVAERTIGPFREGLRELGYIEGQTLLIEWRFVDERSDRAATLATELVRLGVDLLVAVPG